MIINLKDILIIVIIFIIIASSFYNRETFDDEIHPDYNKLKNCNLIKTTYNNIKKTRDDILNENENISDNSHKINNFIEARDYDSSLINLESSLKICKKENKENNINDN